MFSSTTEYHRLEKSLFMLLVFILRHLPIQNTDQYISELERINKDLGNALQITQRLTRHIIYM